MNTTTMAAYLAANIPAIACDEAAGELFRDVQNAVDAIERMINRPVEPKYCGNCTTPVEDKAGAQHKCAIPLYVAWDHHAQQYPAEVQCWRCKITYNVDVLIQDALGEVDGWLFTAAEVLDTMAQIGEPISERTWRHWRKTGAIQSRNELGVEPKYFIGEVRYLRQTFAKTGRAS